jgi:hypothetical protein
MYQDSWGLYEAPRHPKKWIFHPRKKRSVMGPLLTVMAAIVLFYETVSRL